MHEVKTKCIGIKFYIMIYEKKKELCSIGQISIILHTIWEYLVFM